MGFTNLLLDDRRLCEGDNAGDGVWIYQVG